VIKDDWIANKRIIDEQFRIILIGRVMKEKGIEELIAAVKGKLPRFLTIDYQK
jgi:glycosyltransferase involved in cell wall biosynthesis